MRISKPFHYYRAMSGSKTFDLQSHLNQVLAKRATVDSTEAKLGKQIYRVQRRPLTPKGDQLLHITSYTPGEKAQTIVPKLQKVEDNEGLQSPPQGKDFKHSECFLLISGCNVIFCGNGISLSRADAYISSLIQGTYKDKNKAPIFDIKPAGNLKAIDMINRHGVKSVDLNCHVENLAFDDDDPNATGWKKIKSTIKSEVSALVAKDHTRDEQRELEDLFANVSLSLDGNTKASKHSQDFIRSVAKKIIDDHEEDEFLIVTQKGEPIKSSEIKVKETKRVDTNGNFLESSSVFSQLMDYLSELKTDKII